MLLIIISSLFLISIGIILFKCYEYIKNWLSVLFKAPSEQEMLIARLIAELNKLEKSDLIKLIVFKKLPDHVNGYAVLKNCITNDFKIQPEKEDHNKLQASLNNMEEKCKQLKREVVLSNELNDQMNKRLCDKEEIIIFLKASLSNKLEKEKKAGEEECSSKINHPIRNLNILSSNDNISTNNAVTEQNKGTTDQVGSSTANKRNRQSSKTVLVKGSSCQSSCKIQGADSDLEWLHVSKVKGHVDNEIMLMFLQDTFPNENIKCFKLNTKGNNSSFKIGVLQECKRKMLNSEMWPQNVVLKDFKFFRRQRQYHISNNDSNSVLACCRRFGHQEPTLWVQALWSCVRNTTNPSMDLLNEILTVIAKEKLFSPQLVIDAIGTGNADISLGHIRSYITNELQQEQKKTKEIADLTSNYRKDTDKLKDLLEKLKGGIIEIRGSRCAACHHTLELPKIHFLCEHSFHQHCFQSFSDDENECPTCQPENKNLVELLKAREYNKDLHETFHSQLEKAHDGFSVVAEYLSRGVFNRYKIITNDTIQKTLDLPERNNNTKQESKKIERDLWSYGAGAEARLRQSEVKSNPRAMPVSEGRLRMQEQRYSQSLEANMTRYAPRTVEMKNPHQPKTVHQPKTAHQPKTVHQPLVKNPFDDEDYDESKNPFNDEEDDSDTNNPFREELAPY